MSWHATPQPGPCHPRSEDRCDSQGRNAARPPPRAAAPNTHTCPDLMLADVKRAWELGVPKTVGPAKHCASEELPGGTQEGHSRADGSGNATL